jgi:hypothetical protein
VADTLQVAVELAVIAPRLAHRAVVHRRNQELLLQLIPITQLQLVLVAQLDRATTPYLQPSLQLVVGVAVLVVATQLCDLL